MKKISIVLGLILTISSASSVQAATPVLKIRLGRYEGRGTLRIGAKWAPRVDYTGWRTYDGRIMEAEADGVLMGKLKKVYAKVLFQANPSQPGAFDAFDVSTAPAGASLPGRRPK